MSIFLDHSLSWSALLLVSDAVLWHLAPFRQRITRVAVRLALFALFSVIVFNAGVSPLQPPLFTDDRVAQLGATALGIVWWLYAARVLTELIGLALMRRIGHSGRLLQDVIGALVFLAAIVAAAGYVLELPVKGLLATSGVVAIVVGLALQSTLSDVFSGIVLNTTKPYQVDDWVVIDGVEGKVLDIDWRATHLLTSAGSTAVVPNSVAAKAKIVNLSRPGNLHGVSISIQVPNHVRPRRVLDALERTLQGSSSLCTTRRPGRRSRKPARACPNTWPAGLLPTWAKKARCATSCSTWLTGIWRPWAFHASPTGSSNPRAVPGRCSMT